MLVRMRRWRSAGGLATTALAASALAGPKPSPTTTWADWVGAYRGTLAWTGCSVAGAKSPLLALDIVDGVAAIDLAPARAGMPVLTLVGDDRGWSGRQGDVAVAIKRAGADRIDLAVDLDSGCAIRGRLARSSTGVAACDALIGWARIESRCTRGTDAPLEDLAKLAATRWKPAEAARCRTRAASLERALVERGCAPHPDPQIGVRARACLELSHAADKLARCGRVPPVILDPLVAHARGLSAAAQTAEPATLPYVERQCRDEHATAVAVATRFQCGP